MTKKFYIMLFVTLGFLLGSTQAFAHETKTEMSCCKEKSTTKDCCKKNDSEKITHSCDTSCVGSSCGCPAVYFSSTPMAFSQTENNALFSFSQKKQSYYYSEIFISSGFRSIWLPPKIS